VIGAIADDFTGGTDVAVAFRRAGLRTEIVFGDPRESQQVPECDAVVVALKTRTVPVQDAVDRATRAADWLRSRGAGQLYFKYCSTFDSTPEGNIGQVADALAALAGADVVAIVPSSPEHGRTQYQGHLFVGDTLLADSPMRHHPLTPMRQSRVKDVLMTQTDAAVELIQHAVVRGGAEAVRAALSGLRERGVRYAVIDAVDEDDLTAIGEATKDAPLVTGAAGLAGGLARIRERASEAHAPESEDPVGSVPTAVLAGSCSSRTLQQIAAYESLEPVWFIDVATSLDASVLADRALAHYDGLPAGTAPLFYSSVSPERLRETQQRLGTGSAAALIEETTGKIAQGLVARGVRRLVVAGGETSGAVVSALDIRGGHIGAEQAQGVPWIYTPGSGGLALLLKSGNFGPADLLVTAAHTPTGLDGHTTSAKSGPA
jgi:uncharacterized protein YgbK (DUF1537 family)